MQFSAVDLPQPEGPSRATNSPRSTVSVTSRSACVWPKSRLIRSSRSSRKSREAIGMRRYLPTLAPTCWSQRWNA